MASRALPVLPRLDAMEPERPPPALPSELLEEIFLRVASPADLVRASAACVSVRRLISNPSFLRRYRSIHPPLLLGFLDTDGFHPVEATHPSAAVARAVARTADFSFDSLPDPPRSWDPCDVRDGRVLVGRTTMHLKKFAMRTEKRFSREFALCDPLAQRYLLLPRMTHDLLASVGIHSFDMLNSGASLIPSEGMEEETLSSVICWMISEIRSRLAVFVFSTRSGHWAVGTSASWADLGLYEEVDSLSLGSGQCVYGCFYWKVNFRNKLLKLDMNTMELSTYDLPPDHDKKKIVIVESGEGKVGMFSPLDEGTSLEYYTLLQNGTDKSYEWHLKSTIPLPVHGTSKFLITGQAEGYVFLAHVIEEQERKYVEVFSLEVKSCNIERAWRTSSTFHARPYTFRARPYFGFPPSMSPRRIQEYGED